VIAEVVRGPFDLCRDGPLKTFDSVLYDIGIAVSRRIHPSSQDAASVNYVVVLVAALLPIAL
jgi:hypothetical protein